MARERLALQSSKAWTMVGIQSTGWDPLNLGPTNAAWSGACMLVACGMKIKHAKETSEVFDLDRLLETSDHCNLLLQGPSTCS